MKARRFLRGFSSLWRRPARRPSADEGALRATEVPSGSKALLRAIDPIARWLGEHYFRAEIDGLSRIPPGPALLVGNHNAGVMVPDSLLFFRAYAHHTQLRDVPVSLGHDLLFRLPVIRRACRALAIVAASPDNAHEALRQGRKVLVYPGGDWEAMRPSRDRDRIDFGQRMGFIELAMEAGVPIVPIVAAGAHDGWYVLTRGDRAARALGLDRLLRLEVFPVALALPTGIVAGPAPLHIPIPHKIVIEVAEPIRVEGDPSDRAHVERAYEHVVDTMQARLDALVTRLPRRLGAGRAG